LRAQILSLSTILLPTRWLSMISSMSDWST
jgi:hypothetical protein